MTDGPRVLFYDTETTGMLLQDERSTHPGQPHIAAIAATLMDRSGVTRGVLQRLIRPQGWTMPADATAVHGLTMDVLEEYGTAIDIVLDDFWDMACNADLLVAHNEYFDRRMVRTELIRLGEKVGYGQRELDWWKGRKAYCTQRHGTKVAALGPSEKMAAKNMNWNKAPKLSELFQVLFGREMPLQHTAMGDVMACRQCYLELIRRGVGV